MIPSLKEDIKTPWLLILVCAGGILGGLLRKGKVAWYKGAGLGVLEGPAVFFIVYLIFLKILPRKIFGTDLTEFSLYKDIWWFWPFIISGLGSFFGIPLLIGLYSKIREHSGA